LVDDNGQPLSGATLTLHETDQSWMDTTATTIDDGSFRFTQVFQGQFQILDGGVLVKTFTVDSSDAGLDLGNVVY
jgi:hypothetical protein